jgi:sulfofructose kinase
MSPKCIVAIGLATLDYLGRLPRFPEKNSKSVLDLLSVQGGGTAATAAAAAAKLGAKVQFIGKIGDDDFGRTIMRGMSDCGVDVRQMVIARGQKSPFSFVVVDSTDASRTVFHSPGDFGPLSTDEMSWSWLEDVGVLLVDGRQMSAQVEAARRARARGATVLLDADSMRPGMEELMRASTVIIASEPFSESIAGDVSLERRLYRLRELGADVVAITRGEHGAIALHRDEVLRVPAFTVEAVDTTGCGDVYHGAFAYGLLQGQDLSSCMRFAAATAAIKCRAVGGREGLARLEEVLALLEG